MANGYRADKVTLCIPTRCVASRRFLNTVDAGTSLPVSLGLFDLIAAIFIPAD